MLSSTTVRATSEGERTDETAGGHRRLDPVRQIDVIGGSGSAGRIDPAAVTVVLGVARLHRLVLESQVAALEAQLEHKQREVEVIRTQYERAIRCRNREEECRHCCLSSSE